MTDDHPDTARSYSNLAFNLYAQGKPREAVDRLAARSDPGDQPPGCRLCRTRSSHCRVPKRSELLFAALLARLDRGTEAWQRLEERWGRGLLDEFAARQDKRLTQQEQEGLRRLVTELERLDRLFEAPTPESDQAERRKRLDDLDDKSATVSRSRLGEMQTRLVKNYGPIAGEVALLAKIQSWLPVDTVLIAWVDVKPPGPASVDPDGEHWGVVVRSQGDPVWVKLQGTGTDSIGPRTMTHCPSGSGTPSAINPARAPQTGVLWSSGCTSSVWPHWWLRWRRALWIAHRPSPDRPPVGGPGPGAGGSPAAAGRPPDDQLRPLDHGPDLPPPATPP